LERLKFITLPSRTLNVPMAGSAILFYYTERKRHTPNAVRHTEKEKMRELIHQHEMNIILRRK
jgi:hypothetical protein